MSSRRCAVVLWLLVGCSQARQEPPAHSEPSAATETRAPRAAKPSPELAQLFSLKGAVSTSLRNPNDGTLEGGVALPLRAPGLLYNPTRNPAHRHGTVEVVQALVRAAGVVAEELGGHPLVVNDLSLPRGGPIPRHSSHQSGRDVDVFFYLLDEAGLSAPPVGAFLDPAGLGVDFKSLEDPSDDVVLRLDVPRTWRFLQGLIEDPAAHLQRIFVAEHLRTLLLTHAMATEATPLTVQRFSEMTCQPNYPHDDHFHFRFFCTAEDIERGCRDGDPIYPWRRRELAAVGVKPKRLLKRRPSAKADIVTHEEARAAAGPMHEEVERWLERRQTWLKQPHPGRQFCP